MTNETTYFKMLIKNGRTSMIKHTLLHGNRRECVDILLEARMFDILDSCVKMPEHIIERYANNPENNDIIRHYLHLIPENRYRLYMNDNLSLYEVFTEKRDDNYKITLRDNLFDAIGDYSKERIKKYVDYFDHITDILFDKLHLRNLDRYVLDDYFKRHPEHVLRYLLRLMKSGDADWYARQCQKITDPQVISYIFDNSKKKLVLDLLEYKKMTLTDDQMLRLLHEDSSWSYKHVFAENIAGHLDILDEVCKIDDIEDFLWQHYFSVMDDLGRVPNDRQLSTAIFHMARNHKKQLKILYYMSQREQFHQRFPEILTEMIIKGTLTNEIVVLVPRRYYNMLQSLDDNTIYDRFDHYSEDIFNDVDHAIYRKRVRSKKRKYSGPTDIIVKCRK